jgi:hypothetical protein
MRFLNARPPYTVLAFASFVTLIFLVSLAREGPHERLIYGGLLLLAATFGLLQGHGSLGSSSRSLRWAT